MELPESGAEGEGEAVTEGAVTGDTEANQEEPFQDVSSMFHKQLEEQQRLRECLQRLRKEMLAARVKEIAYLAIRLVLDSINTPAISCSL